VEAVASFKAACQFKGTAAAFANLGVAYLNRHEYASAYKAITRALKVDPTRPTTKDNLKVVLETAQRSGVAKAELEKLAAQLGDDVLGLGPAPTTPSPRTVTPAPPPPEAKVARPGPSPPPTGSASASDSSDSEDSVAYQSEDGVEQMKFNTMRPASYYAKKAKSWVKKGQRRLARGYLTFALHIDPVLRREDDFVAGFIREEKGWDFWEGDVFTGFDKTLTEHVISTVIEQRRHEAGIFSWRNLQLTHRSCCGYENVGVYMSGCSRCHQFIIPFYDTVPELIPRVAAAPGTAAMYSSFRQWYMSSGLSPPTVDPIRIVSKQNRSTWDWNFLRVALPPSQLPAGWQSLANAGLLYRLAFYELSRLYLVDAFRENPELEQIADDFVPGLWALTASALQPAVQSPPDKYIVVRNAWIGIGNVLACMASAWVLAQLTGRKLLVDWNVNTVTRTAFTLQPDVQTFEGHLESTRLNLTAVRRMSESLTFFHMSDSQDLGMAMELIGCRDLAKEWASPESTYVHVSTNLYFAAMLDVNPHYKGKVASYASSLKEVVRPGPLVVKRARAFVKRNKVGKEFLLGLHVRARVEGEDNDDWPRSSKPEPELAARIVRCIKGSLISSGLKDGEPFSILFASTTKKARKAMKTAISEAKIPGLKNLLMLDNMDMSRRTVTGAQDALAEALLLSRADSLVRVVIGTQGFSSFQMMINALRHQDEWTEGLQLRTGGDFPNFMVTDSCLEHGECFFSDGGIFPAYIAHHGSHLDRSCGNIPKMLVDGNWAAKRECHLHKPVYPGSDPSKTTPGTSFHTEL